MKNIYYIKTNYGAHKNISEIVLVAKRRGERSIGLPWFFKIHKLFRVVYSKTPSMWLPRSYMRYIVGVDHIQKSIQSRWKILVGAHIVYTAWRCICYYCVGQHRYQYGRSSVLIFVDARSFIVVPRSPDSCVEQLPIFSLEVEKRTAIPKWLPYQVSRTTKILHPLVQPFNPVRFMKIFIA